MLKNYIITAINNLLKNKLYSAINIIGLAVGLTACLLITLYVQNELSCDTHWEKADLIYRVNVFSGNADLTSPNTSGLLLPALKRYFPEDIEFGARIERGFSDGDIQIGDARYQGSLFHVDKEFINIFQVEVLKGSMKSTFQGPGNIALSEESANKYFGNGDPIGEIITFITDYHEKKQYIVSAVYRFTSPNTALNVPNFSLLDESDVPIFQPSWIVVNHETYIRFKETADIDNIVDRLPEFVNNNMATPTLMGWLQPGQKVSDQWGYSLQKISYIYFNPNTGVDLPMRVGNKTAITVFIIISLSVLIIGCINFIILNTANATQRSREVAMRKVLGARFKQLLIQFLGESLPITFLAILCSIAFTELALPFFADLVDRRLTVPYYSLKSYMFVLILLLSIGLLGGLYPSLVLSRFSPTRALKANQTTEANGSFKLRNVLVIFQFSASIILIIATIVASFQLLYTNDHPPGFNPDNLLVVEGLFNRNTRTHRNALRHEIQKLPSVDSIGLSSLRPNSLMGRNAGLRYHSKTTTLRPSPEIKGMYVDYNFFKTYEIPLLSGRTFIQGTDKEEPLETIQSVTMRPEDYKGTMEKRIIINSTAVRKFGFASAEEAVGSIKILESGDPASPFLWECIIIGVVADSQYRDLRLKPEPEIYRLSPDSSFYMTIKYHGDYQIVVEEVRRVWNAIVGDDPFRYSNIKYDLATTFSQEEQDSKVLMTFAFLSVFISCMGLFGMAAFTVERRVKEIGLRKIMGAKVKDIVNLLGWNFLKPVLIAIIIAWPVAIFAMQIWLEKFPYRFNPLFMIPICLISGFIALAIAWFTVAGNTKRVAKGNPVHALRYE